MQNDMKENNEQQIIYDLIIKNGCIVDPKTSLSEVLNIGISGGKIVNVTGNSIKGLKEIDAANKIVSPGFIDFYSHINGKKYAAECMIRQGATTTIGGYREFDGIVIKEIAEEGFLINHGFCISESFTFRTAAGIWNPYRPPTKQEINTMCDLTERFLDSGALGLHFALEYFPGTTRDEMISLFKIAKEHNSLVIIHLRKCGCRAWEYLDEIFECVEITGASVHIVMLVYHAAFGDAMSLSLKKIEEKIAQGLDLTADSGVYNAFIERIGSKGFDEGWQDDWLGTYQDLLISSGINSGKYCDERMFHFLREEFPYTMVTAFVGNASDIAIPMSKPYVFISSNAADGSHYPGIGHPETSGTFPKLIGHYVREKKILNLIDAVNKITYLPAQRFGIKNKGWIGIGADADIVIFDYNEIKDNADYLGAGKPDTPPSGIDYVIVNGEITVENNHIYNDKNAGKLLLKE